jgi:hypothetical protein
MLLLPSLFPVPLLRHLLRRTTTTRIRATTMRLFLFLISTAAMKTTNPAAPPARPIFTAAVSAILSSLAAEDLRRLCLDADRSTCCIDQIKVTQCSAGRESATG